MRKSTKLKRRAGRLQSIAPFGYPYLLGCDIEWLPYEEPASGGADTGNSATESVLGSGKSDDDKSTSDAEAQDYPEADRSLPCVRSSEINFKKAKAFLKIIRLSIF